MKKMKIIAVVMAVLLAMTFAACAQGPSGQNGSSEGEVQSSDVKVGLITDVSGLGDQSINDQAQAGMDKIAEDFGVQVQTAEPADDTQTLDMMQKYCDMGFDVIVCCSFSQEEALKQVAPNYPDTKFVIIDTIVDLPNVMSFTYATHEGAFLAGAAAAMKSESGVVGFVGGMNIPTIEKYEVGFTEGAAYINPEIQVIAKYIGTDGSAWSDPATAKSLTNDMIANGADVCFHAAGGSGLGMIEACAEKGAWAIGVNIDQSQLAPETVLTSELTRGDVAIHIATEKFLNGEDVSGHFILDCSNDGVGLVQNEFFTEEEQKSLEEIKEKIISGEIEVTNVMDY